MIEYILKHPFPRFVATGILNTGVDLVVLNVLLYFFANQNVGTTKFLIFKSISFIAAVANSYLLNKYWVFGKVDGNKLNQGISFTMVSLGGLVLNAGVSSLSFAFLSGNGSYSHHFIATVSGITGTIVVFGWNYFGYKFFVFNNKTQS